MYALTKTGQAMCCTKNVLIAVQLPFENYNLKPDVARNLATFYL